VTESNQKVIYAKKLLETFIIINNFSYSHCVLKERNSESREKQGKARKVSRLQYTTVTETANKIK